MTGALQGAPCQCGSNLASGGACLFCGREVRTPGVLGRELRHAYYLWELLWASGEGLDRRRGFNAEVGPNPDPQRLHDALLARVVELPAVGRAISTASRGSSVRRRVAALEARQRAAH